MPWVRYRTTRSRGQQCREPGAGWDSRRRHSFGEAIFGGRGPCCDTGPATGWPGFSAAAAVPSVGGGLKSSSCAGKPNAAGGESGGCRDIRAYALENYAYALVNWRVCSGKHAWKNMNKTNGRCHVNHRVTSLWAPTPEIMQWSSLAATVSSRRRGIGGAFGGRPDGVGR